MWIPRRRDKAKAEAARQALEDAQQQVLQVTERTSEVRTLAKALREIRERNHFAEQVEEIILRRRGSTQ